MPNLTNVDTIVALVITTAAFNACTTLPVGTEMTTGINYEITV